VLFSVAHPSNNIPIDYKNRMKQETYTTVWDSFSTVLHSLGKGMDSEKNNARIGEHLGICFFKYQMIF